MMSVHVYFASGSAPQAVSPHNSMNARASITQRWKRGQRSSGKVHILKRVLLPGSCLKNWLWGFDKKQFLSVLALHFLVLTDRNIKCNYILYRNPT